MKSGHSVALSIGILRLLFRLDGTKPVFLHDVEAVDQVVRLRLDHVDHRVAAQTVFGPPRTNNFGKFTIVVPLYARMPCSSKVWVRLRPPAPHNR